MKRVGVVLAVLLAVACTRRDAPTSQSLTPTTPPPSTTTHLTPPPTTTPRCTQANETATDPVPPSVLTSIGDRVNDPRFSGKDVSISIWIDGWGEVAARQPDLRLLPASNQKLLTAMGAFEVLGAAHRFVTSVRASGALANGELTGDLVLVGGGDPTLRRTGRHSLAALAQQVRASGITRVRGALLVDESRYDDRREADGWLDWHRPTYAGSLSALVVDNNQYRSDAAFLADPALAGGELFGQLLEQQGVAVAGPVAYGSAAGSEIGRVTSAPSAELIDEMLMRSDNMIAESLVKEIAAVSGATGSTAGGLAAIRKALERECVPVAGADADGSGLSRANARSAREWRQLLVAARSAPWGPELEASLPTAGQSGTLASRLMSTETIGNVRAKTGSIIPGRSLSGYLLTASGRPAAFSVVVNGEHPGPAQGAIDALVIAAAAVGG